MNKTTCQVALALVMAVLGQSRLQAATYSSIVMADIPHGYWRLGESSGPTVVDETANNLDGTYLNGPTLGNPGLIDSTNTSAQFDGVDDFARIVDAADPTSYSIETWVKLDALPPAANWRNIIWRTDSGESSAFSHMLQVLADGTFRHYTFDGAARQVDSTTKATAGETYHIVGVYSPSPDLMAIYVNGVLEAAYTGPLNNPWAGGDRWLVGSQHASLTGKLDGTLDELAVYHSALNSAQIAEHYIAGDADTSLEVSTFSSAAELEFAPQHVLYAVNVSNDLGPRTVNGLDFISVGPSGTGVPGVIMTGGTYIDNWGTKPELGATPDDNDLEDILHDIRYVPSGTISVDAAIRAGVETTVRLLFSENHPPANADDYRLFDIFIEGLHIADEFDVAGAAGIWTTAPDKGVMLTFTFISTDTNLDIEILRGTTGVDNNSILAALIIEQVPEPQTYILGMCGAVGIALLVCRRRRPSQR